MATTEYQLLNEWGGERYVKARASLADWYLNRHRQNLPPIESFDEVNNMDADTFELFMARVYAEL